MTEFNLINSIKNLISLVDKQNYTQNIEVFLIKVTKSDNEVYKQESDDKTKKILLTSIIQELQAARFINREVISYDLLNTKKNVHELVLVNRFSNIREMLDKFNDENQYLTSTKGLNESKFHLYMVSLKVGDHTYKIIGSFSNVLELRKKFLLGNFTNSKINFNVNNSVFGFNKKIDLFIVDDKFVIINQAESKFESVFKMNKRFSDEAIAILNDNKGIKQIFDDEVRQRLIDKVSKGKRMANKLIKIVSDEERFNKTVENINKLQSIIDNKKHKFHNQVKDIQIIDGQLFADEGNEGQLLAAISDAFYQAIISETENVDESRV